ncbi:hypothetical protein V6Z12_A06G158700 [Gossypium hirsutum]
MGEWSSRVIPIVRGLCLLYVTHKYLGTTVVTYGPSMLPTLGITGNVLLMERISTRTGKLRPGDVVFFRSPENPRRVVCKRLVGMEGDQVTYVVDPKNSDKCNTIVKEITYITQRIRGISELFLMVLWKAKLFGRYCLVEISDPWHLNPSSHLFLPIWVGIIGDREDFCAQHMFVRMSHRVDDVRFKLQS